MSDVNPGCGMSEQTAEPQLLQLLIASAYANYCSSLIGGPPIVHKRFEFFRKIKVGDLVMEVSSLHRHDYDEHRIGYLVSDQMEPYGTNEWWEEVKDEYEGRRPQECREVRHNRGAVNRVRRSRERLRDNGEKR